MLFKFGAYLYTGSATMLSESIHSLADVLNQVKLFVSYFVLFLSVTLAKIISSCKISSVEMGFVIILA